jgi:hypothetical protein
MFQTLSVNIPSPSCPPSWFGSFTPFGASFQFDPPAHFVRSLYLPPNEAAIRQDLKKKRVGERLGSGHSHSRLFWTQIKLAKALISLSSQPLRQRSLLTAIASWLVASGDFKSA